VTPVTSTRSPKSIEEILDVLRTSRDEIHDFDAAIQLLDRLEADLEALIAQNRLSAIERISIGSDLKLQAA